ncbi:MAG: hypothetical protein R3F29_06740 [Planctomycetota bacterium]
MKPFLAAIGLLALSAAPAAQITVSMTVPSPIDVTCSEGGTVDTDTQPVGAAQGFARLASTTNTFASLGAGVVGGDASGSFAVSLQASIYGNPAPGASASIGPASVLLYVSCATTTGVQWQPAFTNQSSQGLAPPSIDVDLGDDGIVDFVNGQQTALALPATIGPQALPVRITFSAVNQQPGNMSANLSFELLPRTLVTSSLAAIGCPPGGSGIAATPTFLGEGVRLGAASFLPNTPWVAMVIGWNTQPVLLPSYGQAPCLFVPTPDVVVLQGFGIDPLDVPLPPAVRPLTFWIQGVIPDSQLLTTDCLRVDAF